MKWGDEIAEYLLGRGESSEAGKRFSLVVIKKTSPPPLHFKKGGWVGRLK
jgi:hypothetical protein